MGDIELTIKTITTSLRPHKVVVLVNRNDPGWQVTCLRIIEWYSQVWGGAYNLIVPTDGKSIDKTQWELLDVFDPDYARQYVKTRLDFKIAHPEEYQHILEQEVSDFIKEYPGADPEMTRKSIDEQARRVQDAFSINEALKKEIMSKLNPFYHRELVTHRVFASESPSFPLTHIIDIIPKTDIRKIDYVEFDGDSELKLLVYSVIGSIRGLEDSLQKKIQSPDDRLRFEETNPRDLEALNEIMASIKRITYSEHDIGDLFNLIWEKGIDNAKIALRESIMASLGEKIEVDEYKKTNFYPLLPYPTSLLKCAPFVSAKDFLDIEAPIVLVVGSKIDDFCLYYNLSRLRERVLWLPYNFLEKFKQGEADTAASIRTFLSELPSKLWQWIRDGHHDGSKILVATHSLGKTQLDEVADLLNSASIFRDGRLNSHFEITSDLHELLPYTYQIFETGNELNRYSEQFLNGRGTNFIKTPEPLPENFKEFGILKHSWVTEVAVTGVTAQDGYKLPRKEVFSKSIFQEVPWPYTNQNAVRISRYGIAYKCPSQGLITSGVNPKSQIVRPRLYLLDSLSVFKELFGSVGYSVAYSDKGNYLRETMHLFGSLESLGSFMLREEIRKLFGAYLDESKSSEDKGVFPKSDRRRYLSFKNIDQILGNKVKTKQLLDDFTEKGVLQRGLIFQCERCRNASWYAVGQFGRTFTCNRCDTTQVYTSKHWKKPEEPQWYYRLAEVVYQGYAHDMIVPILTSYRLLKHAQESFIFTPELEFRKNPLAEKPDFEVDICCVVDGGLVIGECKKGDSLTKKELKKYTDLAGILNSDLLFATLSDGWNESTLNKINERKAHITVNIDLYNRSDLLPPT